MYPLTILLGVGYIRKDWTMSLYASIIAGIGMGLAAFHYSLQKIADYGKRRFLPRGCM